MHQEYELEKWVWTEEDFERMGWHDSRIYALAFSPETFELLLDIDYIFQWINPEPGETFYKFWVAPATLIFENVSDVDFDIGRTFARACFEPIYSCCFMAITRRNQC